VGSAGGGACDGAVRGGMSSGGSSTSTLSTRFDKLFSGLVVPRSVWTSAPGRGTERLTPDDLYGPNPAADHDYGMILEQAAARHVKGVTSPRGVEEGTRFEPATFLVGVVGVICERNPSAVSNL